MVTVVSISKNLSNFWQNNNDVTSSVVVVLWRHTYFKKPDGPTRYDVTHMKKCRQLYELWETLQQIKVARKWHHIFDGVNQGRATFFVCGPHCVFLCVSRARLQPKLKLKFYPWRAVCCSLLVQTDVGCWESNVPLQVSEWVRTLKTTKFKILIWDGIRNFFHLWIFYRGLLRFTLGRPQTFFHGRAKKFRGGGG